MAVGQQATADGINSVLTSNALQIREACRRAANFQEFVVSLGLAGLEAVGYSAADAQTVLNMASYMNTVALVYFGGQGQGPAGQAAQDFNFDNALCQLWGGQ